MIHTEDILDFPTQEWIHVCRKCAKAAEIGGRSQIHQDRGRRKEFLGEDQLIGQLGEAALSLYTYGNLDAYIEHRAQMDADPTSGDGGFDLPGIPIDVKTSLMRSTKIGALDYKLCVRERERHKGIVYVLALVPMDLSTVRFIGWLPEEDLPCEPEPYGTFAGAFVVRARRLKPIRLMDDFIIEQWPVRLAV